MDPLVSLWLGTESQISAHFDFPSNLATVIVGERQFTLYPPDMIGNLYVGPMERTPAGQPISLTDSGYPNDDRYPGLEVALEHALQATLGPGDAIYIPSLWWHEIKSRAPLNGLVNYWWRANPAYFGSPFTALQHLTFACPSLPKAERERWRPIIEHYIFGSGGDWSRAHSGHGAWNSQESKSRRGNAVQAICRSSTVTREPFIMTTDPLVRRVLIVGGGTAGWMTAAALSKLIGKHLEITLVESDAIGTIGVGEATIPTFIALHQLLKIPEAEFLSRVQGTIKLGISFERWQTLEKNYIHAFGTTGQGCWAAGFITLESRSKARPRKGLQPVLTRARGGRIPQFGHIKEAPLNYAYHLDATAYAKFLRTFAEGHGVRRVEGQIETVHTGSDGAISAVQLKAVSNLAQTFS